MFKNKAIKKATLTSLLFIFLALATEIFQFSYFGWGFFPAYWLFDISLILFFAFLIFAIPRQWGRIVLISALILAQIVLTYTNICVFHSLETVFNWEMLGLIGEAAEVSEGGLFPIGPAIFIALVFISMIVSLIFISKIKDSKGERKKAFSRVVFATIIVSLLSVFGLFSFQNISVTKSSASTESMIESDVFLANSLYSPTLSLKKFGTYAYYIEDLCRSLTKKKTQTYSNKEEAEAWISQQEYNPTELPLYGSCSGEDVIVIMAESFEWFTISEELTPVLYALANGYDFSHMSMDNDYFYSFEERGDGTYKTIRADNQYDYTKEDDYGLTMANYYSKSKTDYSETSVILGSYPFNQSFVGKVLPWATGLYENIDYSFSLPNMLSSQGYATQYYHPWKKDVYSRKTIEKMHGFDSTTFYEDVEGFENYSDTLATGVSDSAFIQLVEDDFIQKGNTDNYFSFFTSAGSHGSYDNFRDICADNYAIVDDADWLKTGDSELDGFVRNYFAGTLELEFAVARLVYSLIKEGKFNNTTIVFFADHNTYYNKLATRYKQNFYSSSYYEKYGENYEWAEKGNNLDINFSASCSQRFNVPAFIYSTKLNNSIVDNHVISKFTNAFDITATLLTIMGIDYNPSKYMGYPVICDVDGKDLGNGLLISGIDGMVAQKIYSEDGSNILYKVQGTTNQDIGLYQNDINKYLKKWLNISALYKYDLFGA